MSEYYSRNSAAARCAAGNWDLRSALGSRENLKMGKYRVPGCAGFIGSALLDRLLASEMFLKAAEVKFFRSYWCGSDHQGLDE
jgi:hypothetical protein